MSLGQFGRRPAASQRLQRDYRPCGHSRSQARREDTECRVDEAERMFAFYTKERLTTR